LDQGEFLMLKIRSPITEAAWHSNARPSRRIG
jgi:hypothetical protein